VEKSNTMISVKDAIEITLNQTSVLDIELVSILEAAGRILAEDVYSDIAMPPFDKSSVDGYALRASDLKTTPAVFEVIGFIPAGSYPEFALESGQAAKIMTGAPLPRGTDCVQMVEKTEALANGKVKILEAVAYGKNISKKSEIIQVDARVISKGTYLSAAVIAVLATVGKSKVQVYQQPRVGILVTGDELVEIDHKPQAGQIRNSNGYALYHQVKASGARPERLGIAPDRLDQLTERIAVGLQHDVLLISGGVSMGELDLVEEVFAKLGMQVFYDKVNIKPGKPTVFGKKGDTLVFGLPGNPVSASTVFEVIARPALRKMMGFTQLHNPKLKAIAASDFASKTRRENYAPAWTYLDGDAIYTTPLPSKGSADIVAFANSNSYMVIASGVNEIQKGQTVDVLLRDEFWKTCSLPKTP
jgi:molybdopterin molybdotransferase